MTIDLRSPILLAVLAATFCTPAWAQSEPLRKGWGLAAGLGTAHVKDVDGSETFSGNDFGYSFEFEYRFNEHFALAASSINLGEATDTFNGVETRLSVRGAGLVGRFILPVSSNVDVYGRLGSIVYFADLEPGGINGLFGDDAFEYGLGVDFLQKNNLAFRLEARFFDGRRDESGSLLTAGVSYRF